MAVQIAVVGKGGEISKELEQIAEQVGEEIAKAGAILICGGMDGIMVAACRGTKKQKGTTVGILPHEKEEANEFVDVKIPTKISYARNSIVASSADSLIAVGGGVGTLIEILFAIRYGKPVILLDVKNTASGDFDKILNIKGIKESADSLNAKISKAKTAKEAVELAVGQSLS